MSCVSSLPQCPILVGRQEGHLEGRGPGVPAVCTRVSVACVGVSLATKDHDPSLLHSRQSMYRACSFHIAENLKAFFYFWLLYIMDLNNKERF